MSEWGQVERRWCRNESIAENAIKEKSLTSIDNCYCSIVVRRRTIGGECIPAELERFHAG